ncbi:zinc finger protein 638 isoform X1 [Periophthalmus magnuspinnatus]|uniref:zinc finger protein 638 isoform X1 n=1 Tax=Periophthalmus magnuspinnatus TaxID=409849 RepID=UPI00243666BB|nr:zinc finger protein 638 isoform X1 [Periophthalmus magnuspinnatus]XP_055078800.1 zinc finger protein 638 isoform X1 [Periophthalmus magnuspinnatus]
MYHHHQPQGPQGFPGGPRPQTQPPVRPPADMMPPVGAYQFPRPTQLPDELESALSIRGSRDMDHRLIEHLNRLKQHQSQTSAPGMSQQHGNYGTNLCDTQPKQQSVDWSNYEPPTKLFAQHPGGHTGTGLSNWNPSMSDSSVPSQRAEGGRGFYTPESAGTILASFGLSNEDLEALSHYPDDQLTPDTLPFILRDLQIHKNPKASHSPDVPSLLSVTQTEGRVIDYGHASQAKDENGPPKTFKKEPISTERTVKMFPSPAPKLEANVGRQVRLEPAEPIKHGDRDYRRRSSEHQSPPPRDFSTAAKPRHQDRDYRLEQPKPRASAEKRSGEATVPKPHPPPSVKSPRTGLKAPSNKKLPTPTMMSDFSGVPPKVYPHTCSLCDMQCDQEQEWIGHLETVNHTAACRHLRTKYPDWKPKLPSRDYGKRQPAGHSGSRSASWSPPPPPEKHRGISYKVRGKAYNPHHIPRHHPYHTKGAVRRHRQTDRQTNYSTDVDARFERQPSRGGTHFGRYSFREYVEKKELAGASRTYLKRPHLDKRYSSLKGDVTKKTTLIKAKTSLKPSHGPTRLAEEGPPAKKKKAVVPVAAHGPECLVYLMHIPKEATEQEVINLAGSFGPINNVLLMPSPDEEEGWGQQASVCMMKAEDAQTFASAPNLLIRDRVITATVAMNPEEQPSNADRSIKPEQGSSADHPSEKKKGVVLIEELPDRGWTEEHLKALAEPFGYPDDIIIAKQIGKALLLMPDVETAREMVKVHTFSPASINEHKVTVKNVYRNIGMHTPVALYNLLMHGVDGATKTPGVVWSMLLVVSNVPQSPSSASIVHKLVSRIGTVFNTLAVNNMVICEMATAPLATAVYRHYLKFPCMIQNSPLVFSRKPDPKTPVKVIPAFLETDKEVPEDNKELPTVAEVKQTEIISNPEPKEEIQAVDIKCEKTEERVDAEKANTVEKPTTTTFTTTVKEEPTETQTDDVVKSESKEGRVTEEAAAEQEQTSEMAPKENGAEVQTVEEAKLPATTEGGAVTQDTTSEEKLPKAISTEGETQVKASRPSAPSGQKQTSREKSKDPVKNSHHSSSSSREEERKRTDRERRERESRDRERRERERSRKDRDYDERSKRDYERERRLDPRREDVRRDEMKREESRREEMKRAWRREWERREGKRKPYVEADYRRSDGSRRSHHRDDRHKSSSERRTVEEDFPFSLSDFVTVDEVGDVDNEAPDSLAETETGPGSEPGLETQTEESPESGPPLETEEKIQDVSVEDMSTEEPEKTGTRETEVKPEQMSEETTKETSVVDAEMTEADQPEEGDKSEITEEPCPSAAEETSETNQDEPPNPMKDETQQVTATFLEEEKVATTENDIEEKQETDATTAPSAAEPEASENGEKDATENAQKNNTLPPFDPSSSVGLEYLVPMSGFFCKVCTRFFTGTKDAQIGHSKTLKHYENLQKFLTSSSTSADEAGST